MTIDLSHGEFRALVAKAFRGAGYSWGLTEDAAFAAGYLAERGVAAAEFVVRLLSVVDGRPTSAGMPDRHWQGNDGPLCPICVGTSLADRGGCDELMVGPTAEPMLVAPFLMAEIRARVTTQPGETDGDGLVPDSGYTVSWPGGACEIAGTGLVTGGVVPVVPVTLTIVRARVEIEATAPLRRVQLSGEQFDELERFAHRVYAPATEASRAGGAGAGTSDND